MKMLTYVGSRYLYLKFSSDLLRLKRKKLGELFKKNKLFFLKQIRGSPGHGSKTFGHSLVEWAAVLSSSWLPTPCLRHAVRIFQGIC